MAGVVFISAREDAVEAQYYTVQLEQALYPVDVRVSLRFGQGPELHALIQAATGVIVLWSRSSVENPVIRIYADIAAEKGNLVSVLSWTLPWPTPVEGKPISRYEYHRIPKSEASSLFPPWLTASDNYVAPDPSQSPSPPLAEAAPWNVPAFVRNSRASDVVLFALPGIIILSSFLWGVTRGTLSIELVGWGVLCAALVNLMRGLRV